MPTAGDMVVMPFCTLSCACTSGKYVFQLYLFRPVRKKKHIPFSSLMPAAPCCGMEIDDLIPHCAFINFYEVICSHLLMSNIHNHFIGGLELRLVIVYSTGSGSANKQISTRLPCICSMYVGVGQCLAYQMTGS